MYYCVVTCVRDLYVLLRCNMEGENETLWLGTVILKWRDVEKDDPY